MMHRLLQPHWAALLAFIAYGCWSALCNAAYGTASMIIAFAVQGSYAFASTLLLGRFAQKLMQKLSAFGYAQSLTLMICLGLMCAIPFSLHRIAGTPEVVNAMLPGLIIGSLYLVSLLKLEQQTSQVPNR